MSSPRSGGTTALAGLRLGAHHVFVDDLLVRLDAKPWFFGQVRNAVADGDWGLCEAAGDFAWLDAVFCNRSTLSGA